MTNTTMVKRKTIITAVALTFAANSHAFTVPYTHQGVAATSHEKRSSFPLGKTLPTSQQQQQRITSSTSSTTSLNSFLGNDGGILGVGTPELFVILLVGYFVLGPSDLYKLTKEIGKAISNFRTLGSEATKSFENTMETQLEMDDLRKAQRELNDAFSFRRSINTDETSEAFSEPEEPKGAEPIRNVSDGKKKRIRRKKKKVVKQEEAPAEEPVTTAPVPEEAEIPNGVFGDVPDLSMEEAMEDPTPVEMLADEAALREERMDRLSGGAGQQPDWMNDDAGAAAVDPLEQERFASQLAGDWNERILANEDKLSPLAQIMERIAILEEEKNAADARIEEEFRLRNDLEEKYYRSKREMLEEAAAQVQAEAYINPEEQTASSTDI